jgi:hypothetical protein
MLLKHLQIFTFLEKACTYQVRAMAGSLEFNQPSDAAIETTRQQGQAREMAAALLWPAVKAKNGETRPILYELILIELCL